MSKFEGTQKAKTVALKNGADLVGVVGVSRLAEYAQNIHNILPSAQSVIVVAAKHSLAAISLS